MRLKLAIAITVATLATATLPLLNSKKTDQPAPEADTATSAIPDFAAFEDTAQKKSAFFGYMKELTDKANKNVISERKVVEAWDTSAAKTAQIDALLQKYRVDATDAATQKTELLKRIQVIPASLVLAQSANESAWGTSRFARQGNNFFGQWCFTEGCGLVPSRRPEGAYHEVARFDKPEQSVASYIRNLNSNPTYDELRNLRAAEMAEKGYPTGYNLAAGLEGYSERGMEYVQEIRKMITYNKIDQLDVPTK